MIDITNAELSDLRNRYEVEIDDALSDSEVHEFAANLIELHDCMTKFRPDG